MTGGEAASPHGDAQVKRAGPPPQRAKAAVVMLHGRGADASDMLRLAEVLAQPDLAYLAPQAAGRSWYPYSFLAPIVRNEPFLSSALDMLDRLLDGVSSEGLEPDRVVLLGFFSKGPRLGLFEYAGTARAPLWRHRWVERRPSSARRAPPRDYARSVRPALLSSSDAKRHRSTYSARSGAHETARVLRSLGAAVMRTDLLPGMGHGINDDEEIKQVRTLLAKFSAPG